MPADGMPPIQNVASDEATIGPPAQAALAYLGLGWSVVPALTPKHGGCSCGRADCPSSGKHPRVAWEHLTHHPPGVEEVLGWWRRWPDANVAVVTGSVSGVAVVDVDARMDGERALAERERAHAPLTATVESRTGGGSATSGSPSPSKVWPRGSSTRGSS